MAIGNRIKQIRKLRGLTQKELGIAVGFSEKTADIRIAQYESGTRNPQDKITKALANALNVDVISLNTPDLLTYNGIIHTFFSLEDMYGIKIEECDGIPCIKFKGDISNSIKTDVLKWLNEYKKLQDGEITVKEYNEWRYTFPESESKETKHTLDELRKNKS